MKTTHQFVFWALLILSWLIFVGLSIEAGGYLVNFIFTIVKPESIPNLYQKLDLSPLYTESPISFYTVYSLILCTVILKSFLFYKVTQLMHRLNLKQPFNERVANIISQLSTITLSIGALGILGHQIIKKLVFYFPMMQSKTIFSDDRSAFILMGAILYIIAFILKKGVELQNENELTV
ncbi:MAG: DUF2975 domain-containing protein [Bacteroidetes bacterium]|nr:DUF2975 domain-containing protein [Bacteroidota bacterium]